MRELAKLRAENAALKAQLGRVKASWGCRRYGLRDRTVDTTGRPMEGSAYEMDSILSTAPEVLAVVDGFHNTNNQWSHDGFLAVWETQYGRAGRPVTAIIISREEAK